MRDNLEEFIEDYTKAFKAHSQAPPEKKREAMEKAVREIWDRRRREKKVEQQQQRAKKK